MIIKGKARSNARQLGKYLLHNAANENTQVLEVRSGRTQDVKAALLDMELANELTKRGEKPLYSVEINPAIGEDQKMTREDWILTADNIEKELGFEGQERVLVWQEKRGKDGQLRQHVHAVWSRVKDGKLIPISHNYLKHDIAREKTEKALGHKRTLQPKEIKQELTRLWQNSIDGKDFIQKAYEKGYTIGKGERRAYKVLTPDGQKLDFVRQLQKVKTHQVKERFKEIHATLPDEKTLGGQPREREKQNKRRDRTQSQAEKARFAGERKRAFADRLRVNKTDIQQQPAKPTQEKTIEAKPPAQQISQTISQTLETDKLLARMLQEREQKAIQEQAARLAAENFKDITAQPEPKIRQTERSTQQQEEKLQEFKANSVPEVEKTKEEKAHQAGQNFKDITRDETDDEREIREAFEQLRNDDFGLEHEL